MQKTANLNLNKPELTDAPPDITVLDPNWDTLDAEITAINSGLSNKADKDLGNVITEDFLATIDRTEAGPYIFAANKADLEEAIAGTDDVKYMTPLATKEAIDASTPYRVGDIRFLGYPLNDDKYLPCNGQLLDSKNHSELFAKIGTAYGGVEPLENLTEKNIGFMVHDMAAGNGLLVAVGIGGQIAVSGDNGASWSQKNSGLTYEPGLDSVHVTYGNGIFIIYGVFMSGSGSYFDVYGTGDGIWIQRAPVGMFEHQHTRITYDMAYGNNMWLRVGTDIYTGGAENIFKPMIYSSTDNGETWSSEITGTTGSTDLGTTQIMSVAYGNGVFRTVGDRYYAGSTRTIGKFDGVNWSRDIVFSSSMPGRDYHWIYRVLYIDNKWLALGRYTYLTNGAVHIYRRGSTYWEVAATLVDYKPDDGYPWRDFILADIAKSDGLYVCAGTGGVASSTNGINWRIKDVAANSKKAIYSGGTWFIVLNNGKIATTTENYGQFYLPDYNNTMPHCHIKAKS
jgi:hypothetical protein